MKNILTCNNCGNQNPLYEVNCSNCGSYLRERIFNIDLWSTISLLIESPVKGFQNIIKSEHKNFLVFILILTYFKFWVNSVFISLLLFQNDSVVDYLFRGFVFTAIISMTILLLVSLLIKQIIKIKTRYKDIFSILTYSQIPHFFAAMILFPIELIIFGQYLFSVNPSPFLLKESVAYLFLSIEGLIILWSILLNIFAIYSQTGNKKFAIAFGAIVSILLFAGIIISSTIQNLIIHG